MGVDLVEYGKAEHRAFHLLSDSHELEFFEEKFGVHLVDLEYSPRPGDWRLTFYTLNKFAYDFWYLVEVHEPALLRVSAAVEARLTELEDERAREVPSAWTEESGEAWCGNCWGGCRHRDRYCPLYYGKPAQ